MTINKLYFKIADIFIEVKSDLPSKDNTFDKKFDFFRVQTPGKDIIRIHHHFNFLNIDNIELGRKVYHKEPWEIYQQPDGWVYLGILPEGFKQKFWKMALFSLDHSEGHIYHPNADAFRRGGLVALTNFTTDQILVARLLADRGGCYLHSAGAILNGSGVLFVGHSEAGKSTTTQILLDAGESRSSDSEALDVEILCDDRNIVRRWGDGWRVFGSWSHGDIPYISAASAPLRAICFLEQSSENKLIPLADWNEINRRLLDCLIKPFVTIGWWEKTLDTVGQLGKEVPCYRMKFDKTGKILNELTRHLDISGFFGIINI